MFYSFSKFYYYQSLLPENWYCFLKLIIKLLFQSFLRVQQKNASLGASNGEKSSGNGIDPDIMDEVVEIMALPLTIEERGKLLARRIQREVREKKEKDQRIESLVAENKGLKRDEVSRNFHIL